MWPVFGPFFKSIFRYDIMTNIENRAILYKCPSLVVHRKKNSEVKTDEMAATKVADSCRLKLQTKVYSSRTKTIVFAV